MASTLLLVILAVVLYSTFKVGNGLRLNIAAARKSGLPYIVVPVSPFNRLYQVSAPIWLPIFKMFPKRYWQDWIFCMTPDWSYRELQAPYARLGDSFLVVSPDRCIMWTQSAEAIAQITSRREDFPKPTKQYQILAMYGRNVLTTEGLLWRLHRKATSASFNERNAAHTFAEAIHQTQGMLGKWLGAGKTITSIEHDTMTLALNIIGYVGFGLRFIWPGQKLPEGMDPKLLKYGSLEPPEGHSMTFANSLETLLHRILVLLLIPKGLLPRLPFKWAKEAHEAQENYVQYMKEFLAEKIHEVQTGNDGEKGMDIMGNLVRAKYGRGKKTDGNGNGGTLTDDEIIGNAFIIIVAGHETTANTLHFALLELAANPAAQRALQADVDRIFGAQSDPAQWNYEQTVNPLLASHVGAAMNETLRMMPAVVEVPKKVKPGPAGQVLTLDGTKHLLEDRVSIAMSAVAVARNPKYWPTKASKLTGETTDLDDFLPERWFRASESKADESVVEGADTEDYGGFKGPDTSAALFRPVRGAFIPFSEGARSCLGRRIAQVEMIAALAVIFQKYSLELAVDDFATDAQVSQMGRIEKAKLYQRAQARCRETIRGASSLLTLKLHGQAFIPVRLVERGKERFVGFMDP